MNSSAKLKDCGPDLSGRAYTDPETGLIYLRARYYDPTTAQFLTRDPLDAATRSAYGYVDDNPLNASDPSGLFCVGGFFGTTCPTDLGHTLVRKAIIDPLSSAGAALQNGATWVNQNIQFSGGICPVFGCVGISYQNGHVSVSGGVGLVIAFPGVNASYNPSGAPPCGASQSNTLGVNTPWGQGGYSWPGDDITTGGSWNGGEGPSKVSGWGGGFVHNWTYTW